jgi:hypothetical protein
MDVHQRTVVVTVLLTRQEAVEKQTPTFGTRADDLLALGEWLDDLGVRQVAMESTGVDWWPVYHLLEEGRSIVLVNPRHSKAVPGRTTAVRDREWRADLLRRGPASGPLLPSQASRLFSKEPLREGRDEADLDD